MRASVSNTVFALVMLVVSGGWVSARAQEAAYAAGDRVEADVNMASSPEYQRWQSGTIVEVKMWQGMVSGYHIKTDDGMEFVTNARFMRPGAAAPPEAVDAGEDEDPWTAAADEPEEEPADERADQPVANAGAAKVAAGTHNPGGGACQMGARVNDREGRVGEVVEADGPNCRVQLEDGSRHFYLAWMLRAAGAADAAKAQPGGGALTPGSYTCWAANGVAGTLKLVIVNGSQYRNEQGTTGSFTHDPASGQITFQSGPWAGFYGTSLEPGKIGISSRPGGFSNTVCDRT
ncbi:MAG: hypothetical protein ABR559_04215 [Gemmatimonadota bacterium]